MISVYIKAEIEVKKQLQDTLTKVFEQQHCEYSLHSLTSLEEMKGSDILLFYKIAKKQDLALLEAVKRQYEHLELVLMQDDFSHLYDGFQLKALCYITYTELSDDLQKMSKILEKEIALRSLSFHYHSNFMDVHIRPSQVYYVESYHHDVYLHTKCMHLKMRDSLKHYCVDHAYVKMIQVHKSFVVNLEHIKEIQGGEIFLTNGEHIPVGERYKAALNKAIDRHLNS